MRSIFLLRKCSVVDNASIIIEKYFVLTISSVIVACKAKPIIISFVPESDLIQYTSSATNFQLNVLR